MSVQIPPGNRAVSFSAVGDIALHGQYDSLLLDHGPFFAFEEVGPILKKSDIVFGNLESVLSACGNPNPDKRLCLRGSLSIINGIRYAGFNVLSLANNHSFDFGADAYKDMYNMLQNNSIQTVGAGDNLNDARRPLIMECRGIKVLFLAYSAPDTNGFNEALADKPGVAPLELKMIKKDISEHKDGVDCIVVSLHWGEEFCHYPSPKQIAIAREIIDSGARIILGHHSHVLQGIERYHSGVIVYNLGSLMMSGPSGDYRYQLQENNRESMIFNCSISKEGIFDIKIIPTWLDEKLRPTVSDNQRSEGIMKKIELLSNQIADPGYNKFWRDMVIKKNITGPAREWIKRGNFPRRIRNVRPGDVKRPINLIISYLKLLFQNH